MKNRHKQRAKRDRRAARKRAKRRPILIDGKRYSWGSIEITLDGVPYTDFTAWNPDLELERKR